MKHYLLLFIISLGAISTKAQDSTLQTLEKYNLFPNIVMLPVNGKVDLFFTEMNDDLPGPLKGLPDNIEWIIDGKSISNQSAEEGNFRYVGFQFDKGIYTAPSKIPPHNPIVITASYQPYGEKTKVITYCRIYINDKLNAFRIGEKAAIGDMYELKEPPHGASSFYTEMGMFVKGQWDISVNGFNNRTSQAMGIGLSFTGNGPGTYSWSVNEDKKNGLIPPCNTVSVYGVGTDGQPFQYASYDCEPHGGNNCHIVPLKGTTTVTDFDTKNKIIKGYFSGILMSPKYEYVSVSGAFYAHML